jgi:hypothetical protein
MAVIALWCMVGSPVDCARAEFPDVADPRIRIESMIRGWYALLEGQSLESGTLDGLLSESPVAFLLEAGATPGPEDFSAWVSELRSTHPQVEYRLSQMRASAVGDGTFRAHFSFDRYAVDEAGVPHVARREQTWLVRDRTDGTLEVLRIDDRRQLVFPGTGPQIVCY